MQLKNSAPVEGDQYNGPITAWKIVSQSPLSGLLYSLNTEGPYVFGQRYEAHRHEPSKEYLMYDNEYEPGFTAFVAKSAAESYLKQWRPSAVYENLRLIRVELFGVYRIGFDGNDVCFVARYMVIPNQSVDTRPFPVVLDEAAVSKANSDV